MGITGGQHAALLHNPHASYPALAVHTVHTVLTVHTASATHAATHRVRTLGDVTGHAISAPATSPPACPHTLTSEATSVYTTLPARRMRAGRGSTWRR